MEASEYKTERGWAWMIAEGLCRWVYPEKEQLLQEEKPSPEAKPTLVRVVTESDWKHIKRLLRNVR